MPCAPGSIEALVQATPNASGLAPQVFQLSADDVSMVVDPEGMDDEAILDAARTCPVDAIMLIDQFEGRCGRSSMAFRRTA